MTNDTLLLQEVLEHIKKFAEDPSPPALAHRITYGEYIRIVIISVGIISLIVYRWRQV
jgi:hypothetical protein